MSIDVDFSDKVDTILSRGCISRDRLINLMKEVFTLGMKAESIVAVEECTEATDVYNLVPEGEDKTKYFNLLQYVIRVSRSEPSPDASINYWIVTSVTKEQYRGSNLEEALDNLYNAEFL